MSIETNLVRPGQWAQLLLASGESLPRQRARDQQADLTGGRLKQRVLQRLVELDPEPAELAAALARLIDELGEPSGPTRAIARLVVDDYNAVQKFPSLTPWLLEQATGHE